MIRPASRALRWSNSGATWSPWLNAPEYQIPVLNLALTLWHVPVYILALIALFCRKVPPLLRLLPLLPILYSSLLHSLFIGSVRYRVPVMPLVYILAAIALTSLIGKFLRGRKATNSAASA